MRLLAFAVCLNIALSTASVAQTVGSFSANPQIELDPQGRTAKTLRALTFTDPAGLQWVVPKGTVVDGASIPQAFFTVIGGPWDGPYRDASIVHDYYCVRKNRTWQAVHRMFYDAMVARNVNPLKAKIMYYAVYKFGPRWKTTLTKVPGVSFSGVPVMVEKEVLVNLPPAGYDPDVVEQEVAKINSQDLSLDQIDMMVEGPNQTSGALPARDMLPAN